MTNFKNIFNSGVTTCQNGNTKINPHKKKKEDKTQA